MIKLCTLLVIQGDHVNPLRYVQNSNIYSPTYSVNESFVLIGKIEKTPYEACLWHGVIRGRCREDIISTTQKFLTT